MMTLNELFRRLSVGEFSNIALAAELTGLSLGTVVPAQQQKIVLYVNDGLTRLYTRFLIKTSDLILEQQQDKKLYPLTLKHAESQIHNYPGQPSSEYFIQDTSSNPFLGDVIKIFRAYDGYGCEKPLDQPDNCYSWFRPSANTLQIPFPVAGDPATVVYQANHREMPFEDLEGEFELPDCLIPALRAYIAAEVFSAMNSQDGLLKSQEYMARFDSICTECLQMGLVTMPEEPMNHTFECRGWA